jgi:hypothetical protein
MRLKGLYKPNVNTLLPKGEIVSHKHLPIQNFGLKVVAAAMQPEQLIVVLKF